MTWCPRRLESSVHKYCNWKECNHINTWESWYSLLYAMYGIESALIAWTHLMFKACKLISVILTNLLTYLLSPWSRVLLEKLTGSQLVKFPAFYRTWRFITAVTSARHLSLSWASLIQSIPSHPTSWRSILILSSRLCLGLPSGLLPSGFPTKTLYTPIVSPICATISVIR